MDFGRCLCALCVIAIHVSGVFEGGRNDASFYVAHIIDGCSRFSVPAFFMFSGYVLCGKTVDDPIGYVKSKVFRLIAVYLLVSMFYYIFDKFYQKLNMTGWFFNFIAGHSHFHLWFIGAMIGVYAFYPIFMRIREVDKKYISLFAIASIVLVNYGRFLNIGVGVNSDFSMETAIGPLYFLLGFCADYIFRFNRRICFVVFLMSGLLIALADIIVPVGLGNRGLQFGSYDGVLVFIQSLSFFVLVKGLKFTPRLTSILRLSTAAVFGIYLFHHAFMVVTMDVLNRIGGISQVGIIVLTIPIVFVSAGIFTTLIRKVPMFASIL
jgi:surface polysaccharide O-acyltransferase-like enzyme